MLQSFGRSSNPSDRFICLPSSVSRDQLLMLNFQMQLIKLIFYSFHDRLPRGKKLHKYALTVVDPRSRFKAAEPLEF